MNFYGAHGPPRHGFSRQFGLRLQKKPEQAIGSLLPFGDPGKAPFAFAGRGGAAE